MKSAEKFKISDSSDDIEVTASVWQLFLTDNLDAPLNNARTDTCTFLYKACDIYLSELWQSEKREE